MPATITRDNLHQAISDLSTAFVSREAKSRLSSWAYDTETLTLGGWNGCPLDQVGLVEKFTKRARFSNEENIRFANEASEVDAQILKHVKGVTGVAENLIVRVTG